MDGGESSLASNSDSEDAFFGTTVASSAAKLRKSRPPVLGLMVLSQSSAVCDTCCSSPSSSEEREPFRYPETDAMTSHRPTHDDAPSSEISCCALEGADCVDTRPVDDIEPRTFQDRAVEIQSGPRTPFEGSVGTGTLAGSQFKSQDNLVGSERLRLSSHPPIDPSVHNQLDLPAEIQERVDVDDIVAFRPLPEYCIAFRPLESFGISGRRPSNRFYEHAQHAELGSQSPVHRLDVDFTLPHAHGDDVTLNPPLVQDRAESQPSDSSCMDLRRLRASSIGRRGVACQQSQQHLKTQHMLDNENEDAMQTQTVDSLPTKRMYAPNLSAWTPSNRQRRVSRRENVVTASPDVVEDLVVSSIVAQSHALAENVVDSNSLPKPAFLRGNEPMSAAERGDNEDLAVHRFSREDAPMNFFSSRNGAKGRKGIAQCGEFNKPKASSIGRCGEAGRLHQQQHNWQQMSPSNQRFHDANKENDNVTRNEIASSVPKNRRGKPNRLVCSPPRRQRKDGQCGDLVATSVDVITDLDASTVATENYASSAVPNEDCWFPTSKSNLKHVLKDRFNESSAQSKLESLKKAKHASVVRESKHSSKHATSTILSVADTSGPGIASHLDVRRRRCSWLPRHLAAARTSKGPRTANVEGGVAQGGESKTATLLDAATPGASKKNTIGNVGEARFPLRFVGGGDPSTPEVTPEQTEIVRRRRCSWLPRHLAAATSKSVDASIDVAGVVSARRNVRQQDRNLASRPADEMVRRRRCSWLPRHMCSALFTAMQPTSAQKLKGCLNETPLVEHKSKLCQKVSKSPSNGTPRNPSNFENTHFSPAAGLSSTAGQKQGPKRKAQPTTQVNSKIAMPTRESKRRRGHPPKF